MERRHPERAKGFDYLGFHRYLLKFCTHQRAPVFTSTASVELVLGQISRAANEERLAILAYCFMPDHPTCSSKASARGPIAAPSSSARSSIRGSITRKPIDESFGSDMDMTMSFAMASEQAMSSDTSLRTR